MRHHLLIAATLLLAACTSNQNPPAIVQQQAVHSEFGVDVSPYAYGHPSPYGYAVPWGQPDAVTGGYLGANRFSPRQGLICERSRNICYTRNGIDLAATDQYLGNREQWNRQRLFGDQAVYIPSPQ